MESEVVAVGRCSRVAIIFFLFVSLAPPAVEAAQTKAPTPRKPLTHPLFESWYDGRRNLVLAACSAGPLTEQDLLLFRLMKRQQDVAIFHTWEKTRRAKDRERLTEDLERALRELAYTMVLSEQAPNRLPTVADEKFIRYLKYPVYQWVWIERVLKPTIQIKKIDLIKYYHDHAGQYYRPESVRVRYIFREVPGDALIEQRDKLKKEMEAVRARAVGGADFVELAREESDAPSAVRGGELPLIPRGTFVSEFENAAFALEPGQISPVFWGPGGLYIVQCIEKFPEQNVPFADAQEDLRKEVEHKTLEFLYDYELFRLLRRPNHEQHGAQFRQLAANAPLLAVGGFRLTKAEMLHMFPYVIDDPVDLNERLVGGIIVDELRGELVAQQVEKHGFAGDPLLVAADRIARRIWRATEAILATQAVPLTFTEDQVRSYYESHRDKLGYQPMRRVLRITASVRNPYLRHPTQLTALRRVMKSEFEQVLREFQRAFLEERTREVQIGPLVRGIPSAGLDAGSIPREAASTETLLLRKRLMALPDSVRVFAESSTTDYEYAVEDLGFLTPKDKWLYRIVENLEEGDYSKIGTLGKTGKLASYFLVRSIPGTPVEYDKIRSHVRSQYIASLQEKALSRLREELKRQAALRIRLPEIGTGDQQEQWAAGKPY